MILKIGLTGGIGSGKTTVAKIFTSLGIPVFFADLEARQLMETSDEIIHSIKSTFGDETYDGSVLNRKFLANVVFKDASRLQKLNKLVHPIVHRHFENWIAMQKEAPYLVEEAALLCESGAWKFFDFLLLVIAPHSLRIKRVMDRDNVTEEEVLYRMRSQMPEEDKILHSHFLIFNDDKTIVLNQVLAFHEKMISLNKK